MISIAIINSIGKRGHTCLVPLQILKGEENTPITDMEAVGDEFIVKTVNKRWWNIEFLQSAA